MIDALAKLRRQALSSGDPADWQRLALMAQRAGVDWHGRALPEQAYQYVERISRETENRSPIRLLQMAGHKLVCAYGFHDFVVHDVHTQTQTAFQGQFRDLRDDGARLAYTPLGHVLKLLETDDMTERRSWAVRGRRCLIVGEDALCVQDSQLLRLGQEVELERALPLVHAVRSFFSRDARFMAVHDSYRSALTNFDLATGRRLWSIHNTPTMKVFVSFSSDGSRVWVYRSFGHSEPLGSFDAETGECLVQLGIEGYSLVFATNPPSWGMAGVFRDQIILWNAQLKVLGSFKGHPGAVQALTFAPDGRTLVSADDQGHVFLWDLEKYIEKCTESP